MIFQDFALKNFSEATVKKRLEMKFFSESPSPKMVGSIRNDVPLVFEDKKIFSLTLSVFSKPGCRSQLLLWVFLWLNLHVGLRCEPEHDAWRNALHGVKKPRNVDLRKCMESSSYVYQNKKSRGEWNWDVGCRSTRGCIRSQSHPFIDIECRDAAIPQQNCRVQSHWLAEDDD